MKGTSAPEYDRRLSFVGPAELADRVMASARAEMTSINSWLRRACLEQLAKENSNEVQRRA